MSEERASVEDAAAEPAPIEPSVAPVSSPPASPDPVPIERRRSIAVMEVLVCSGYFTQFLVALPIQALGIPLVRASGELSPPGVILISLVDTLLLLTLVIAFIRRGGERPRDVFFGTRQVVPELALGILTLPLVFALVVTVHLGITTLAPFLRNVPTNPFQAMLGSPLTLAAFIAVAVLAGAVREELQRAFLLHRFEHFLGGRFVGLAVTSMAFGAGHTLQGWDAAIITGLLGASWGALYLWRRSTIATMVSHALFNIAQVTLGALLRNA